MDQSLLGGSSTTNTAIGPNDLPAGFTLQDPHQHSNGGNANNNSAATNASMQQQQQQQKQSILEQVMEPDALARLRRIQLVKPQKATMLENAIIQLATTNKLTEPISDGKFVEMLERQLAQEHRRSDASAMNDNQDTTTATLSSSSSNINRSSGISIRRKKYAIDSDDDDDNDDDLL
jgi:programmed cell death protein 5